MATKNAEAYEAISKTYEWGFHSDIEQDFAPKGLSEETVRFISAKKGEPQWMLDWRLKAYAKWLTMESPDWAKLEIDPIDYQDAYYYAEPKAKPKLGSLDEVDPEILRVYEKLGIPIAEQKLLAGVEETNDDGIPKRRVAVDAVFDSVSVATTFRKELESAGVIFRSISEAIKEYPELVKKWLGKVVPQHDNYFATLNSAVFSDGTFVYIPEGVRCPMELSTYFRINAENTGQFERTLIVAEKGSYVSYLEGCTAPMRDENQLHAAVVELVAMDDAEIKYSTVQNWYPGDENGKGGIYNFVTKRALCQGKNSKVSWTQVETGSAITWKYPSCVLAGERSGRRILFGRGDQQPAAGRYRHQDDPPRQEQRDRRSCRRGFRRGGRIIPIAGSCGSRRRRRACATSPSAIHCCSAISAARTPCRISRCATRRRRSSMKRRPARSATTRCSTRCRAGWIPRRRSR